jgi:hypothetical protein
VLTIQTVFHLILLCFCLSLGSFPSSVDIFHMGVRVWVRCG